MALCVAGIDEAGRGPLAGPVVAAAVVFPEGYYNQDIKDSKQLSPKKREYLYQEIVRVALSWSIVAVGARRIDHLNIRNATKLAMNLALKRVRADKVLIDGNMLIDTDLPQEAIIKGDQKILQISAASILAKVYRDHLMNMLDNKYPGYQLNKNMGYPTKDHYLSLNKLGSSRIHRFSFHGVR